jgi:hypothetical protein
MPPFHLTDDQRTGVGRPAAEKFAAVCFAGARD